MAQIRSYRDLDIWQRGKALAVKMYKLSSDFPETERFGLISQLRRCAVSVPSNIAEGWGRNSNGNFVMFLKNSNGSLCELETQIEIAFEIGMVSETQKNTIIEECAILGKMINKLISTINNKKINEPEMVYFAERI